MNANEREYIKDTLFEQQTTVSGLPLGAVFALFSALIRGCGCRCVESFAAALSENHLCVS
jgi:hypothetical protein